MSQTNTLGPVEGHLEVKLGLAVHLLHTAQHKNTGPGLHTTQKWREPLGEARWKCEASSTHFPHTPTPPPTRGFCHPRATPDWMATKKRSKSAFWICFNAQWRGYKGGKTLLRLERLEDLAFFKSRAHCCKKRGNVCRTKREGHERRTKGHMFNPIQHSKI